MTVHLHSKKVRRTSCPVQVHNKKVRRTSRPVQLHNKEVRRTSRPVQLHNKEVRTRRESGTILTTSCTQLWYCSSWWCYLCFRF